MDSSSSYLSELNKGIAPNPTNNVFSDIWGEYERVILDGFLERGAISLAQHDKSLHDLIEKMGEHDENWALDQTDTPF